MEPVVIPTPTHLVTAPVEYSRLVKPVVQDVMKAVHLCSKVLLENDVLNVSVTYNVLVK